VARLGQSILRCPGWPQLKQFPPEALLSETLLCKTNTEEASST
jgi:hypothetical protein